jgi:hypothetical protein
MCTGQTPNKARMHTGRRVLFDISYRDLSHFHCKIALTLEQTRVDNLLDASLERPALYVSESRWTTKVSSDFAGHLGWLAGRRRIRAGASSHSSYEIGFKLEVCEPAVHRP